MLMPCTEVMPLRKDLQKAYLGTPSHHMAFAVERAASINVDGCITSVCPLCWIGTFELVVSRESIWIYAAVVGTCFVTDGGSVQCQLVKDKSAI